MYNATVKLHLGVVAGGDHDPGRGAPLPDGEGDVGSGHRAGEHQHPHLYYILYCTVLYVLYCTVLHCTVCTVLYRTPARRNTAAASPAQRAELWRPSYPSTTPRVARSGHSEARWDSRPWVTCNIARREYYLLI